MIDLYYWSTPNGHKITMMLEECGIEYNLIPLDLTAGDQLSDKFLEISPNGRMPAIVDHVPLAQEERMHIFESGAILVYLAEKVGKFLPNDIGQRFETMQWLFWQARLALLMFRIDGLSHAEIAHRLKVSESMVAKYIGQALRHCRDRLWRLD